MNYALLLSGGTGTRTGSLMPKQYVKADGLRMVTYALRAFFASGHIDSLYVVSDIEWREAIVEDVAKAGFDAAKIRGFALPGENRQLSILNGMEKILSDNGVEAGEEDTVIVHDAARPFLTEELLDRCYGALKGHDGVMPVVPMKDTVYRSFDGKGISELLNRSEIFAGQAPELFAFKKYYEANRSLLPDRIKNVSGASEPAILAGMDIAMVTGDEKNCKVTTAEDLMAFLNSFGSRNFN